MFRVILTLRLRRSTAKGTVARTHRADEIRVKAVLTLIQGLFGRAFAATTLLGIAGICGSAFAAGPTFPFLDTGVQVYSNVTVTSKSATHVFITHSKGFAGLKVNELNHETLVKLGYEEAPKETQAPRADKSQNVGTEKVASTPSGPNQS